MILRAIVLAFSFFCIAPSLAKQTDQDITEHAIEEARTRNATATLNMLLKNYDKRLRPKFGGRPVTVYIDMYIVDIGEISVTNMVRFVFMYFTVMKAEKLYAEAMKTLRDDTQHMIGTHEHG